MVRRFVSKNEHGSCFIAVFWLQRMSGKLAHDYASCGCRCCSILARLSSFLLSAGTREEVRTSAVPLLEGIYTRLLEHALRVKVAGPELPPGASGEASGSGRTLPGDSGVKTPGIAGEAPLEDSGAAAPGRAGAAAPDTTWAESSPPPDREVGGISSKGRGLPPLARLRKRDRRDEGDQLVETEVKEEQPADNKEPVADVEEKRAERQKEKESSRRPRPSKESREEDRKRKRSKERARTRRSRSRSRRRDRRRRERTPPRSPPPQAELGTEEEGGESEAGEADQEKEFVEEEAEAPPADRPKPREPPGPPPGFGRGRWGRQNWGGSDKPKKKKSKGKKHVFRNQDYWRRRREQQRGARLWHPRGGQRQRQGGRGA